MNLLLAIFMLSLERILYALIWNNPEVCTSISKYFGYKGREPNFICCLMSFCKLITLQVFISWFNDNVGSTKPLISTTQILVGSILIILGQALNALVWHKIGLNGVCYGNKFGKNIPWCTEFPFSVLAHPQYTGVVLTIWGIFTFVWHTPQWYAIPLIETFMYLFSALYFEA